MLGQCLTRWTRAGRAVSADHPCRGGGKSGRREAGAAWRRSGVGEGCGKQEKMPLTGVPGGRSPRKTLDGAGK